MRGVNSDICHKRKEEQERLDQHSEAFPNFYFILVAFLSLVYFILLACCNWILTLYFLLVSIDRSVAISYFILPTSYLL